MILKKRDEDRKDLEYRLEESRFFFIIGSNIQGYPRDHNTKWEECFFCQGRIGFLLQTSSNLWWCNQTSNLQRNQAKDYLKDKD